MVTRYKACNILFLIILLAILFSSCDKGSNRTESQAINSNNIKECVLPQNPYNDGGGHDAGFNWAMENGGGCDGNSDSFNDGCEEYHRQMNQYNECIAQSRQ